MQPLYFVVVCYVTLDMYLTIILSYGACLGLWYKVHGTVIVATADCKIYWNVLRPSIWNIGYCLIR